MDASLGEQIFGSGAVVTTVKPGAARDVSIPFEILSPEFVHKFLV